MNRAKAGLFSVITVTAILSATLFGAFPSGAAHAAGKRELVVIVNKNNSVASISKDELSQLFLGKRKLWAAGEPVKACDMEEAGIPEEKTAIAVFSQQFLDKSLSILKNYWIKMIFSGKGEPPAVFKKPGDVIRYVSENNGAIGYVYEDQLSGEVRPVPVRN